MGPNLIDFFSLGGQVKVDKFWAFLHTLRTIIGFLLFLTIVIVLEKPFQVEICKADYE